MCVPLPPQAQGEQDPGEMLPHGACEGGTVTLHDGTDLSRLP